MGRFFSLSQQGAKKKWNNIVTDNARSAIIKFWIKAFATVESQVTKNAKRKKSTQHISLWMSSVLATVRIVLNCMWFRLQYKIRKIITNARKLCNSIEMLFRSHCVSFGWLRMCPPSNRISSGRFERRIQLHTKMEKEGTNRITLIHNVRFVIQDRYYLSTNQTVSFNFYSGFWKSSSCIKVEIYWESPRTIIHPIRTIFVKKMMPFCWRVKNWSLKLATVSSMPGTLE